MPVAMALLPIGPAFVEHLRSLQAQPGMASGSSSGGLAVSVLTCTSGKPVTIAAGPSAPAGAEEVPGARATAVHVHVGLRTSTHVFSLAPTLPCADILAPPWLLGSQRLKRVGQAPTECSFNWRGTLTALAASLLKALGP